MQRNLISAAPRRWRQFFLEYLVPYATVRLPDEGGRSRPTGQRDCQPAAASLACRGATTPPQAPRQRCASCAASTAECPTRPRSASAAGHWTATTQWPPA